ncbi:hypothetical protein F0562_002190 [Nyssa sinensis]|uniref:GPN-loop GTPase 3 n=1 Tax=Nyssa sinensis TaxID=561372 RepID=A0A5J5C6B4_9ASTE|nr:hypothetical protein F0562_002190 [Nyssa sinensis]
MRQLRRKEGTSLIKKLCAICSLALHSGFSLSSINSIIIDKALRRSCRYGLHTASYWPCRQWKGQIELFSHIPMLKNFADHLRHKNFNVCAVYLLDSQFMTDVTKFISGCMASLSAMVQLELPRVNILSKMDLVTNRRDIEDYLNLETQALLSALKKCMAPQFEKVNKALIELYRSRLVTI